VLLSFVFVLILLERWSRMRARFHHTSSKYSNLPRYKLRGWKAGGGRGRLPAADPARLPDPGRAAVDMGMRTTSHWMNPTSRNWCSTPFWLAAMAAVIAVALALILAYARRMQGGPITGIAVRVAGLGYAVPGTVIAIGVMLPFAWFDNTLDAFMRDPSVFPPGCCCPAPWLALLFAYVVRFLAVSLQTVEAGLGKIKPSMDDAARSLGMRPLGTLTLVHLPIMRGTLLTALLLVFVDVLKELPATLILRPFDFNTLAVRAFELAGDERLANPPVPHLRSCWSGCFRLSCSA
jgi:iron(III) transport system permease protein